MAIANSAAVRMATAPVATSTMSVTGERIASNSGTSNA
jgi:hypothetical protein